MIKRTLSFLFIFTFIFCHFTALSCRADDLRAQRSYWYNEAKFGMFIHWGLYSILARSNPGQLAEWVMSNDNIPVEQYEPLADLFDPRFYNPEAWVTLAKAAGMRYIVITSKHHDGFCLFGSEYTDYDAEDRGPGRDLLEPLVHACKKHGLKIAFYHSMMDWHHPDYRAGRVGKFA